MSRWFRKRKIANFASQKRITRNAARFKYVFIVEIQPAALLRRCTQFFFFCASRYLWRRSSDVDTGRVSDVANPFFSNQKIFLKLYVSARSFSKTWEIFSNFRQILPIFSDDGDFRLKFLNNSKKFTPVLPRFVKRSDVTFSKFSPFLVLFFLYIFPISSAEVECPMCSRIPETPSAESPFHSRRMFGAGPHRTLCCGGKVSSWHVRPVFLCCDYFH